MIADEHLLVTFNKHYCSGYKHFTCTLIDEKISITLKILKEIQI